jgi:proline dehydrogenase
MRRLLLWMAKNAWLRQRLPKLWFAKRAVRRFMPGEDAESALDAAGRFRAEGISSIITHLGENLTHIEEADAVVDDYLGLLRDIRARDLDTEVSVKLTQLGFDLDVERTFAHAKRIATAAAEAGKTFWIDMEGSAYAEKTIAFYERLKPEHPNTGLCLQSYLRRSAADVQRLLPLDPQIRLVKGAYAEPATIAYQSKHDVDSNFVALSIALLEGGRAGRKVRLGLGTHDIRIIEQVAEHAAAMGLPKSSFEIEMLYGIRMDQQRRFAREGYLVRDLISYGTHWYPWYMRRLAERPANIVFALRQMIG